MFFHVWVANVKITALGTRKVDYSLLLLEIDISLIIHNSFSLVKGLGHATATSEGIWTSCSAHVRVLSLKRLCVDGDGSGLCVVSLGNSLHQLRICSLSCASIHARFDDEVFITGLTSNELAVLGLHDLAANRVRCHVLRREVLTVRRIEVTVVLSVINGSLSLLHLLHDLSFNLTLHHLVFATDSGNTVSLAPASTILGVVRVEELLV